MSDFIRNPGHYLAHPSGIQHRDVSRCMPFFGGSACKYLMRHRYKGSPLGDLRKGDQCFVELLGETPATWIAYPPVHMLRGFNATAARIVAAEPDPLIAAALDALLHAGQTTEWASALRLGRVHVRKAIAAMESAA
jgi:hypothetical protein